jgi:hypothetical protein
MQPIVRVFSVPILPPKPMATKRHGTLLENGEQIAFSNAEQNKKVVNILLKKYPFNLRNRVTLKLLLFEALSSKIFDVDLKLKRFIFSMGEQSDEFRYSDDEFTLHRLEKVLEKAIIGLESTKN